MVKYFLSLLLLCAAQLIHAGNTDSLPYEFESEYILKRDGATVGKISRALSKHGDRYQFTSHSKTTGLIALFYQNDVQEQTIWQMQGNTIQPLNYEYFREKNGKQKKISIQFDAGNQKIITYAGDSHWSMPLENDIYDKLLYEIAIIQRLRNQERIGDIQVADGGKLKIYRMENLGEEKISTVLGDYQTIKLKRHKSNSKKTVTIWYAKELDYFPVKVENIDGEGKTVTAVISQLKK